MKNSIIIFFSIMAFSAYGQSQISRSIAAGLADKIDISIEYADVKIIGWDKNEITVTGTVSIGDQKYNGNHSLKLEQNGSIIELISEVQNEDEIPYVAQGYNEKGEVVFRQVGTKSSNWGDFKNLPKNADYAYMNYSRDIEVKLEIRVPRSMAIDAESTFGDATIRDVSAPINFYNKHGFIEVSYSANQKFSDSKLESTHDFVDVSIPSASKVSVFLQSDFGEILTDHDLKVDKSKSKSADFHEEIFADLNGGGAVIQMMAKHDNVYLRKGR